jgi:hypothetical protein
MLLLSIFSTGLAAYYAKEAYDLNQIGWAMFWAGLLGWDIHSLLGHILT